jgi:hypothetical protein
MPLETTAGVIKLITYVAVVRDERILLVEYVTPPNPMSPGWWIPAPECEFGQDPADRAAMTLDELGFPGVEARLVEVESFVSPGGWHVIFHYRAEVRTDAAPSEAIRRHAWFGGDDLPRPAEFAHGGWEVKLARRMIQNSAAAAKA